MVLKTALTFKSSTFWLAQSGVVSIGPPQVAPAFATKMCNFDSTCLTLARSCSISSSLEMFEAKPTARPFMPGSELSCLTASSMLLAFRAVMKTVLHPACRKTVAVCRPSPREPPTAQLVFEDRMDHTRTSCDQSDFPVQ